MKLVTVAPKPASEPPPDDVDYVPEPPPGMFPEDDQASTLRPKTAEAWPELDAAGIFAPLEPIKYLLAGLDMCPGAPVLVAGFGFSAKTLFAQALAIATAAGVQALGCYQVPQGRVLHVDYEQGPRLTRSRYQRLAAPLVLGPGDLGDRLTLVSMPGLYFDNGAAESHLVEKCQGATLLILDSLRAAAPSLDENDSKIRLVLDMLTRVSVRTGCTVLVVHHARKPSRDAAGGAKSAIRGSGAIFDACGSVLVFEGEKGKPVRVSHEKARTSGRLADDFLIRVSDVEIDGRPYAGLSVTAEALSTAKTERAGNKALDAMKERIVSHLRERGSAPGKSALRERLEVDRTLFFAAMAELEGEGVVTNEGTHKRPKLVLTTMTSCPSSVVLEAS